MADAQQYPLFPATAWAEGRQFNGAPSPHGAWHARLTDGAVGRACTVRMEMAFAMANLLHSPWAFNGLWLSRYPHWRRAGRGPGCLLALCGPAAHRCGHARPAHRAAGAAVDDVGKPGTGGYFCRHHAPSMCPGYRHDGSWRPTMVGGQCWLADGLASATGRTVVERLPGADHCRGASGIEPFAAAICTASRAVSAGGRYLAGWSPAPGTRLGLGWTRNWGRNGSPGVVVAAV